MLELIYATTNTAKAEYMRNMLSNIECNINPLDSKIKKSVHIEEKGNSPRENARIKAKGYYNVLNKPLFSVDSGLYFDNVDEEDQPGVNVRRVKGKELTDEEMITHYTQLANKYGGQLIARYRNAVCLIHKGEMFEHDIPSEPFIISSKPHSNHSKRKEGFPLDPLSIDIKTGKYFFDIEDNECELYEDEQKGWNDFFKMVIENIE